MNTEQVLVLGTSLLLIFIGIGMWLVGGKCFTKTIPKDAYAKRKWTLGALIFFLVALIFVLGGVWSIVALFVSLPGQ